MQFGAGEQVAVNAAGTEIAQPLACRQEKVGLATGRLEDAVGRLRIAHWQMYCATSGGVKNAPRAVRSAGVSDSGSSFTRRSDRP
jgi:hypothetical protein